MADAATGGATGFRHSDGGGAQCEGVCGEGLQACGEDHRVSAHASTDTLFFMSGNREELQPKIIFLTGKFVNVNDKCS